ncbi:MAG TPA: Zn-dependent hydrolase [Flavobacteriales bacterium]|nr:Zn-dependent hydrolase [Flavobacteriales bacterium]
MKKTYISLFLISILFSACQGTQKERNAKQISTTEQKETPQQNMDMQAKINQYAKVKLTTDTNNLTDNEKKVIVHLIKAVQYMDPAFWEQSYGDKSKLMAEIDDDLTKQYAEINYGPWDRLDDNKPFVKGYGPKPAGANFYPHDMTKEEFEAADLPDKASQYTILRRNESGQLYTIPYHVAFKAYLKPASEELLKAAKYAENPMFKQYLQLRAKALLDDNFRPSDMQWMDMKDNHIDVVIGPIENYEDQLYNYKTGYEGNVLIKDMEWSQKLAHFIQFLPELQQNLPVPEAYKQEKPGTRSDLNAYDVVYYSGEANTGGKTIAINLPNDEAVQLKKGTRRLQLKNVMKAKFDKILVPIADMIITPEQRQYIKFDAFFANTMFHEVAHGLGIKNTINGKGMARTALKEYYSAIEEGKADILGLYMVDQLHKKGELDGDMKDYMTTFMASIFRSIRFGAADAHGVANMIRFNYFKDKGAFTRNPDGTYKVNYDKMYDAMKSLSALILKLQGDGDYKAVAKLVKEKGVVPEQLQKDLQKLNEANIPVDIVFDQGIKTLGLEAFDN